MIEWVFLSVLLCMLSLTAVVIFYALKPETWLTGFLCVAGLACFAGLLYQHWGAYPDWHNFLQEQARQEQAKVMLATMKSPKELIDKLRSRLDDSPASARGWYLLGRIYVGQEQWLPARDAFLKSMILNPADEAAAVNYALALWQLDGQRFSSTAREVLKAVLAKNPAQPDALAMLAMDAFEQKEYKTARDHWQRLLTMAPEGSKEASALRKAIVRTVEAESGTGA